jgi:hypothetical protein
MLRKLRGLVTLSGSEEGEGEDADEPGDVDSNDEED